MELADFLLGGLFGADLAVAGAALERLAVVIGVADLAVAVLTHKRGSVGLEQLLLGLQLQSLVHEPVEKRVLRALVASHRLVLGSPVHRVPKDKLNATKRTGKIRNKKKKRVKPLTSSSSSPIIFKAKTTVNKKTP